MPFQPGNKLAAGTNKREFSDMLRIAIKAAHAEGGDKLRAVAQALVDKALLGDVQAIREVADRLDGKVPQQLQHANETGDGPAQFLFQTVYEQSHDK